VSGLRLVEARGLRYTAGTMDIDVKICGLTTARAIAAARAGGARWVGFVFFPPSPRAIDPAAAIALRAGLGAAGPETVGVYVDPHDALLDATADAVDWIQLHGEEPPARAAEIRARLGKRVLKAIPVAAPDDIMRADAYRDAADMILFDAKAPAGSDLPGGNALSFDWSLLNKAAPGLPWMLSGGLEIGNLAMAVRQSGARAVDVSSGVEEKRGVKSLDRIAAFLDAARGIEVKEPAR